MWHLLNFIVEKQQKPKIKRLTVPPGGSGEGWDVIFPQV